MDDAECHSEDSELFFAGDGELKAERKIRERKAKAVCMRCPVRHKCLDVAIDRNEKAGVWGGLNEDQIASERRRRTRRANAA